MVLTRRGSGGGVTIAQDATEISLMDLVESLEGPLILGDCIANKHVCSLAPGCPMHVALAQAEKNLIAELCGQTLDRLI